MNGIVFDIPYPEGRRAMSAWNRRFGLNAYYSGKHPMARKKDADFLHLLTTNSMRRAGIKRGVIDCPVCVTVLWDDGLDIDNHAVIGKCIVDSMKGWLLEDDKRKYLVGVHHEFWRGGKIRVIVEAACEHRKTER